jgi:CBS domain-containing protein
MKVRDIMTRSVLTLDPDCPVVEAAKIFGLRVRVRQLPVVRNGFVRGLLTPFDLLDRAREEARGATVASIMKTQIRTIPPETEAIEAGRIMLAEGLGCLPVVSGEGRLLGILTTSDFLRIAVTRMQEEMSGTASARTLA